MGTQFGKSRHRTTPWIERVFFVLAGIAAVAAWTLVAFTIKRGSI